MTAIRPEISRSRLRNAPAPSLRRRGFGSVCGMLSVDRLLVSGVHWSGDVEEVEPAPPSTADSVLLNGPAAAGKGVDQDEIDRLFG